jgi:uncharacterized protein (DUF1800 family)
MPSRDDLAHLLRRATFGPRAEDVDAAERNGYDATLAALLSGLSAGPDPSMPTLAAPAAQDRTAIRDQVRVATGWWLDRMVAADQQLTEKLTFFWHGHWATSVQKVRLAGLMLAQQQVFRTYGHGDFTPFVKAMLRDPALVVWLDGQKNTKQAPNENLARELMELFTLGIGRYTEDDVRAGAKALTGWVVDRNNSTVTFAPRRHDTTRKTILGRTGDLDADGFADILMAQPANAEFLARRLWLRFASEGDIPAATLGRLTDAYRPGRDITALLRALFSDTGFTASRAQLVKQPVEWAVGAMRQLGVRPASLTDAQQRQVLQGLTALGQLPFEPPSVGGWPSGAAWLTTSATQVRLRLAQVFAARADAGVVARLTAAPEQGRVDALARLLVVDAFTGRTRTVLSAAVRDPRRLIMLGLSSPEYVVS